MFATFLQLTGLVSVIVGAFLVSVPVGIIAAGCVCVFVGEAAERGE